MRRRFTLVERASIVAVVVATSLVAAAAASASSPPQRPLAMWHRWSRAHANAPAFTFLSTVFTFAGPREVRISGVRYEMGLTIFGTPGGGASQPPLASIDLQRSLPRTRPTAFQLHEYDFTPQTGATFTFDKDTMDTSVDLGASIAPSQLAATYTPATAITKRRCTLVTGGHGYLRESHGTTAYSPFSVVTPTSPFFGTLTSGPVQTGEAFDPGCNGTVIISLVSPRVRAAVPLAAGSRVHPCAGRETLGTTSATQQWVFDKVFGERASTQLVDTATDPNTQPAASEAHAIIAGTSIYDLPRPHHSAHGATAEVFSAGDPFMTGSVTFTSTSAPRATARHVCKAGGALHHFSSLRYTGLLAPNTNPLTARFDTAPVALTSRHATLVVRIYR
jgi:hypothetical protein